MSPTVALRRARALALGGLCLGFVSCYENSEAGGRVDDLFDVVNRVSVKICECENDLIGECGFEPERIACAKPIIKKHAAELADWTECSIRAYEQLEGCYSRGCDEAVVEPCLDALDVEDECGEPPSPLDDIIEDEIDRTCLEEISCSDGSFAQGNYCNDLTECRDGSDEQGCEDELRFSCGTGEDIPFAWTCDGSEDCADGSDETAAQCASGSR